MKTIKLEDGFSFEFDESRLDNMRLLDALENIEENPLELSKVISLMFGSEVKEEIYSHIEQKKENKGLVPSGEVEKVIEATMAQCNEAKN